MSFLSSVSASVAQDTPAFVYGPPPSQVEPIVQPVGQKFIEYFLSPITYLVFILVALIVGLFVYKKHKK